MKSTFNRRAALTSIAAAAAVPAATLSAIASPPKVPGALKASVRSDPVYIAISNYRYGMNLFELIPEEYWEKAGGHEAVVDATYGPPLEALAGFEGAATTQEGAIEALRFVVEECKHFLASETVLPMVLAALGYLEGKGE